jgi:hypothetical protein
MQRSKLSVVMSRRSPRAMAGTPALETSVVTGPTAVSTASSAVGRHRVRDIVASREPRRASRQRLGTAGSSSVALRHQRDAPARAMQRLRDPEADALLSAGDKRRPRHAATSASDPTRARMIGHPQRMRRDGQRRVHRRRGGKHARIRDPEVGVVMRPPPGRDHAVCGVQPHPCRAALVRRRAPIERLRQ